jgi:hypothetical protein
LDIKIDGFLKFVTPVKTGVQGIYNSLKKLDSGACPGPDPGFAGMTGNPNFRLFTRSSRLEIPQSSI